MGYIKDVVKGMSWVGTLRVASRGISFVRTAILARILTPTQFGLFGIASLALSLLERLTETGINVVLVQHKRPLKEYVDTAWVISMLRGSLIAIAIYFSAPFVSSFFQQPEATRLLQLISLVPLIRGFINPSIAKFQKDLQFKKEFSFRTAITIIDAATATIVAFLLKDPSAIVYGLIAGALAEVVLSHIFITPKPKLKFEPDMFRHITNLGKWVTAISIFNYFFLIIPESAIGKLLSAENLGFYQMAFKIAIIPITEITDIFGKVTFPVYARINQDAKRTIKAFKKQYLATVLLTAAAVALPVAFPKQIVFYLLGDQWLEVTPLLRELALYAFIRSLAYPTAPVLLALKKQKLLSITAFLRMVIVAAFILPFTSMWGLLGAGRALLLASLIASPIQLFITYKLLHKHSHATK